MNQDEQDAVEGRLRREYREATKVYDDLVERARQHGDQMVKLGDALRRHPGDMLIGTEDRIISKPHHFQIFNKTPIPTIDELVSLTDAIRRSAEVVAQYKERLKPYGN